MRIIAGEARGRRLKSPGGQSTRPTPDRVKEALFSWLATILCVSEAHVLDLFAGTGALGLEALSRGARSATFVESNRQALACLRDNTACLPNAAIAILPMTAARAVARLAAAGRHFDLVFLDPPFATDLLQETLDALCHHGLLSADAVVICEHAGRQNAPTAPASCRLVQIRRFGDVAISLFNWHQATKVGVHHTMSVAVYPGSFDPITYGHLNLIDRGLRVFDKLIVTVAENVAKKSLFTVEERVDMLQQAVAHLEHVEVDTFQGLLVDYAKKRNAHVVLRGLRAVSDFEFEFQLAHMNRRLSEELETVFMMTGEEHFYVSSQLVREVAGLGGSVDGIVPPHVAEMLRKRLA